MAIQIKGCIMSFKNKNLSVVAYCSGWTLWNYKTQDKINDLQGEYFPKQIRDLMAIGDIIIINASDGNAIRAIEKLEPLMEIGNLK